MDFSRKPGIVTNRAEQRIAQFKKWFFRIFNVWYLDLTEASGKKSRECLTDRFPYNSPGNLDK